MTGQKTVEGQISDADVAVARASGLRVVTYCLPDRSSPEFKVEYRRQMAVIAEHDRATNFADRMEPDEDDLKGWV